jgi:hypothetical protein
LINSVINRQWFFMLSKYIRWALILHILL